MRLGAHTHKLAHIHSHTHTNRHTPSAPQWVDFTNSCTGGLGSYVAALPGSVSIPHGKQGMKAGCQEQVDQGREKLRHPQVAGNFVELPGVRWESAVWR